MKPTYNKDACSEFCAKLLEYSAENTSSYCCYYQVITVPPEFLGEDPVNKADCVLFKGSDMIDTEVIENESNRSFTFKNGEQNILEEEAANSTLAISIIMLGLMSYI